MKITDNSNWNVYSEHCGMTSIKYWVMNSDMEKEMSFVNDEKRAMQVCRALNDAEVE